MPIRFLSAASALCLFVACGPRVNPNEPEPPVKGQVTGPRPLASSQNLGREVLIGEMCPEAANGRPGVQPLFAYRVGWVDGTEEVSIPIQRNMARQFSVFGWDGRRVGVFETAGAADGVGVGAVAIGSYAGAPACSVSSKGKKPELDMDCVQGHGNCGVAVALLEPAGGFEARPFEEQRDPLELEPGGACTVDQKLLIDVDNDGVIEAFPVAEFVTPFRGPAEEVLAVDRGESRCEPRFAFRGAVPKADPRDWRGLDVMGVFDLDDDGRMEIIVAYLYSDRRTWAVYSARSSAGRLELVGEGIPWSRN